MDPQASPPPLECLTAENLSGHLPATFNFSLPPGVRTVLTGPSGIGKSSLLRMMVDLDPCQGEMRLGERQRSAMKGSAWRQLVGYLPADAGWWGEQVADHFQADALPTSDDLDALGLGRATFDSPVARLSSGERQRMALLRALMRRPRFLILDEPTSALDRENAQRVEALLATWRDRGVGMLIVSHDEAQVARIADRHLRMTAQGLQEAAA